MTRNPLVLVALVALLACGGGQHHAQVTIEPTPAPGTRATLVGPMCADGQACTCRDEAAPADGGAGEPGEGVKRFEIRIGPHANAAWVTLDGMVLYKSEQHAAECFYVDLAPGEHTLGLRVHQPGGLGAGLAVNEYGPAAKSWYDTLRFACGAPGVCSNQELDEQKAELAKAPHGVHDLCGSVAVKGVAWDTGTAPDNEHPEDLQVGLTLKVYKFATDKPHGTAACDTHPGQE